MASFAGNSWLFLVLLPALYFKQASALRSNGTTLSHHSCVYVRGLEAPWHIWSERGHTDPKLLTVVQNGKAASAGLRLRDHVAPIG